MECRLKKTKVSIIVFVFLIIILSATVGCKNSLIGLIEKKVEMDIINLNAAIWDDSKWDEGTWGE